MIRKKQRLASFIVVDLDEKKTQDKRFDYYMDKLNDEEFK